MAWQDKYGYEKVLKDHLEQLVSEMDRKVAASVLCMCGVRCGVR